MIDWKPVDTEPGPPPAQEGLPPFAIRERQPASRTLREIPILIVIAAVIAFLVRTFVAQAFYIPSGSMLPQLQLLDRVVVSKLSYRLHDPRRGDIVVFDDPAEDENSEDDDEDNFVVDVVRGIGEAVGVVQPSTEEFIKRVVALPGETVEGRNGRVYVNGRRLVEPYLPEGVVTRTFAPVRVPDGRLWVMGDNRDNSSDSRVFGPIKKSSVVGRAVLRVWPLDDTSFL